MKKSVNLTLTTDEIKEAILNYLKGKDIYIPSPEDANIELGEDDYNAYAIVSYTKDVDIDKYDKDIKELTPNSPEEKQYIVLYTDLGYEESEESFPLRWEAQQGRTNIYECIRSNIGVIDLDKSIVCVDSVPLKDSLTVREFVSYVNNAGYIDEEDQIDLEMYD